MSKSRKRVIGLVLIVGVILCAIGLVACDGTQATFSKLLQEETYDIPDGSGITHYQWTEGDLYTLEMNGEGEVYCPEYDNVVCIEKDSSKDFVILNLADVQLGSVEIEWGASFVDVAKLTIKEMIDRVQPDLITMTGDQGYGEKLAFRTVYDYIDSFGIPWAPVFGNHDNQAEEISNAAQSEGLETMYKNCLFKTGPDNLATVENGEPAYGNYVVNVIEKNGGSFKIVKSVIMINSGNYYLYNPEDYEGQKPVNDNGYAFLSETQIRWYKWVVKSAQQYGDGSTVSSMMALHIPIYAYSEAYCAAANVDYDIYDFEAGIEYGKSLTVEQGMNDDSVWKDGYKDSFGSRHEGICCPPYDDHVFEAILDYDDNAATTDISTDLVIAGHDHVNNFVINYKGVTLAYGMKSGSGCYWESDMSGGSAITFGSDGNASIRHEFYNPNLPYLPVWNIVLICIGALAIVLVIIICPIVAVKKKKAKKA